MADDLLDLLVGDEGAVHAGDAPAAGHVEHVALAEQLLGAHLAEDGAAVDLRGDLEGDAGREVRLDRAGDDVDRGALGRHDQVDAGGAGHLGEALDAGLDLLAGDHHQVRHLVDDDDDEGHRLGVELLGLEDRLAGVLVEAGLHGAGEGLARSRARPSPGRCSRRCCARPSSTSCGSAPPSPPRSISARPRPSSGR